MSINKLAIVINEISGDKDGLQTEKWRELENML